MLKKQLFLSLTAISLFTGCYTQINIPAQHIRITDKCNIDNQLGPMWLCSNQNNYNEATAKVPQTFLGQSFQEIQGKEKAKNKLITQINTKIGVILDKINSKKKIQKFSKLKQFQNLYNKQIVNHIHYKDWFSKKGNFYVQAKVNKQYINNITTYFVKSKIINNLKKPLGYKIKSIIYDEVGGIKPIKPKPIKKIIKKETKVNVTTKKNKNLKSSVKTHLIKKKHKKQIQINNNKSKLKQIQKKIIHKKNDAKKIKTIKQLKPVVAKPHQTIVMKKKHIVKKSTKNKSIAIKPTLVINISKDNNGFVKFH